ncbi:hypothetical protein QCD78_28535, partial [Pseudomonas syringae pv. actinidiae]|nr:hypothetical protein [Pseudomonas syringae pv. actinidiae]MDG6421923.1 hypothetical protein [Pseudomonas syringae pv. actinidiae]MDG6427435.1 hypothetical protein [Pseudomonas syringae pv. actinidiae]MDG6437336.1 hypothetical protein [Pseudomonas syringae pv. actinidiae]MDG6442850.1 hypothetical protein [Pseudomonas syringae pv. actinidiae]
ELFSQHQQRRGFSERLVFAAQFALKFLYAFLVFARLLSTHTAPVARSKLISINMPVHEQRWTGFLHPVEPINT